MLMNFYWHGTKPLLQGFFAKKLTFDDFLDKKNKIL
jgi:hypothetical protein